MNVKQLLQMARAKIEQGWTQQAYAREADGRPCRPRSKDAVSWCVVGSLQACFAEYGCRRLVGEALGALEKAACLKSSPLMNWNDRKRTTKKGVLKLFDKAIKECGDD